MSSQKGNGKSKLVGKLEIKDWCFFSYFSNHAELPNQRLLELARKWPRPSKIVMVTTRFPIPMIISLEVVKFSDQEKILLLKHWKRKTYSLLNHLHFTRKNYLIGPGAIFDQIHKLNFHVQKHITLHLQSTAILA